MERIALFIHGADFYATAEAFNFAVDYDRLLGAFLKRGLLTRVFYYASYPQEGRSGPQKLLIDWLDRNGCPVVKKSAKEFLRPMNCRDSKRTKLQLAVDAMEAAAYANHIVLFSGDSDFRSLVEAIQRKGVRVSVISTIKTRPPMIAKELRRQADEFVDIATLTHRVNSQSGQNRQTK